MRLPIHVDDIAEIFVRVLLADAPRYRVYNSGGTVISLGELADIVRGFSEARSPSSRTTGGKERQAITWWTTAACCRNLKWSIRPSASGCCKSSTTFVARRACHWSREDSALRCPGVAALQRMGPAYPPANLGMSVNPKRICA